MNGTEKVDELALEDVTDETPEEDVSNEVLEVSNGEKVEVGRLKPELPVILAPAELGKVEGKDPLDEKVEVGTLCVLFSIVESGRPVIDVPLA
jgi:hypothetical protein